MPSPSLCPFSSILSGLERVSVRSMSYLLLPFSSDELQICMGSTILAFKLARTCRRALIAFKRSSRCSVRIRSIRAPPDPDIRLIVLLESGLIESVVRATLESVLMIR